MDEHAVALAIGIGSIIVGFMTTGLTLLFGFRERRAGAFDKETTGYARIYDDLKDHNDWLRAALNECLQNAGIPTASAEVHVDDKRVSVTVPIDGGESE